MLRLKREAHNRVSIVWNRQTRPSKRLMWRAIFYSLTIHFVMLFVFQIKSHKIPQPSPSSLPIVFLDTEETAIAILGDGRNSDEDPRYRLARELHLVNPSFMPRAQTIDTNQPSYTSTTMCTSSISTLPWPSFDALSPSQHQVRIYPLKITLDHKLRTLHIINDGSTLFGKASPETIFFTSAFSEVLPQVDFFIDVCLKTGRVVQARCSKELFDKRLQDLAERLLKTIRFSPHEGEVISGTITIQFAGTFDTIGQFLQPQEFP